MRDRSSLNGYVGGPIPVLHPNGSRIALQDRWLFGSQGALEQIDVVGHPLIIGIIA